MLTTLRRSGRPQLSNVWHQVDDRGVIRVSTQAGRAKYPNLTRQPWAALHVTRGGFPRLRRDRGRRGALADRGRHRDATVEELVTHYRRVVGEHEDWDDSDALRCASGAWLLRLQPTRAYGMLPRA